VEPEPSGADNTGGRSEGKITTVETPAKPAKRRVDDLRAAVLVLVCVLAVSCTGRSPPVSEPDQQPVSAWPTRGWRTAAPQDQGMDPRALAGIDDEARLVFPALRSVLVVRHGVLVVERYYHGATPATYFNVYSVTKSVTSALIGIALGDHTLAGLDQRVGRLLAEHLPPRPDPRIRNVTVEQVLTMTAGLPPDPPGGAPPSLVRTADWVRFVLSQHPVTKPGTRFAYSGAGSHLLSAIIAEATGQPTLRYAQAKLFAPLGIASDPAFEPEFAPSNAAAYERAGFAWPTDPQGYHLGYGLLKLTARDMAKIGYLYLKGGTWEGRQVVPAAYVRASTQTQTQVPTGGTFGPFNGYGYQWWTATEQGHRAFAAIGLGGQLIEVIPDLDLIVVMTSELTTAEDVRTGGESHKLVGHVVIPAVRD
jgi:CubicO group peptidase (beta-lactamase class C family)